MADEFRDSQQDQWRQVDDQFAPVPATSGIWEAGVGLDSIVVRVLSSITDTCEGSESVGNGTNLVAITDSGTAVEYAGIGGQDQFAATADDSFVSTFDDVFVPNVLVAVRVQDAAEGVDQADLLNIGENVLAESAAGTDEILVYVSLAISEASTGSDSLPTPGLRVSLSVVDSTGIFQDSINRTSPDSIVVGESGGGIDEIAASILATIDDTGAGSEVISRDRRNPYDDLGVGTDSVSVSVLVTAEETALASDPIFLPGIDYFVNTDTGQATDSITVAPLITVTETSSASDVIPARLTLITIDEQPIAEDDVAGYAPSGHVARIEISFSSSRIEIIF